MHVLASSGMGADGLLRPMAMLAVSVAVLVGAVSLWLGPWAVRTSDALVAAANRSVIAAGLDAGRFTELPGKGGIIFVDELSRDGSQLGNTFIVTRARRQRPCDACEAGHRQARPAVPGKRRQRPLPRVEGRLAVRHPARRGQLAQDEVRAQRRVAVQRPVGQREEDPASFVDHDGAAAHRTRPMPAPSSPGAPSRRR